MKYFIGNWKMFGIPGSIKIIDRINNFFVKDRVNHKKYKIMIAPPFTLLGNFSSKFKNKKISICAQNCFHEDIFGSYTGNISAFMLKKIGIKNVIIGHSECRASGETESIIKKKVSFALKNNLNVIFCVGENKVQKTKGLTLKVLKAQITKSLKKTYRNKKIMIAYEPVWSIGTGEIPKPSDLFKTVLSIKIFLRAYFGNNNKFKVLYGGSVDKNSIYNLKFIKELDGFLIGGASKSSKKFIDIIKNFYK